MKVIFSKYAKQELEDAASFYELEYPGLGEKFKEEARRAILRIVDYPEAWSIESGEVRKYLLHKFPYKILYSIEQDYIFIITIAHGHRKPDYWIERNET